MVVRWQEEVGGCDRMGMDGRTWEVQTLLKVTKANVCAIMDVARSRLERARGMRTHERISWGKKARDSMWSDEAEGTAEMRYKRVL